MEKRTATSFFRSTPTDKAWVDKQIKKEGFDKQSDWWADHVAKWKAKVARKKKKK